MQDGRSRSCSQGETWPLIIIFKSLGFVDEAFLAKHPFQQDSRDMIGELRHLVKSKQSRVKFASTGTPPSEN